MIKILHISNDYPGSTAYMNLIRELDNLSIDQVVYSPVRDIELVGKNSIEFISDASEIIYSKILNKHLDKAFYPFKIFKIFKDLQKRIDLSSIDLIHAHTWYSDGGVAYWLARKYNIPFVVAVRNTDLNIFQKKLVYLRSFGRAILNNSTSIVLISGSYLPRILEQKSLQKSLPIIKNKIKIIPNGVDPYWVENAVEQHVPVKLDKVVKLIYVGRLTAGKNVPLVQSAIVQINKNSDYKVRLDIVGSGGAENEDVVAIAHAHPELFTCHGKLYDKSKLAELYSSSDIFVMPSSHETFGLVYVEAMLQGLPVLYTENEGIDGYYSNEIGEKVKNPSVDEIFEKLTMMIENLDSYKVPTAQLKENHDWEKIAKKYLEIYKSNS